MHKVFLCHKEKHAWWRGEAEGEKGRDGGRRDLVSLSHWVPRALLRIVALE